MTVREVIRSMPTSEKLGWVWIALAGPVLFWAVWVMTP